MPIFSYNDIDINLNRVSDLQLAQFEYEKTFYYGLAIVSFIAVFTILISVRQLVIGGAKDTKKSIIMLIGGILMGIMVGFTTCLPLFL